MCCGGRRNAPLSIRLDYGDLLVMDGLAQSECEHSTSSELQGPRVNLSFRWIFTSCCVLSTSRRKWLCCPKGQRSRNQHFCDGPSFVNLGVLPVVVAVSAPLTLRSFSPQGVAPIGLGGGAGGRRGAVVEETVFFFQKGFALFNCAGYTSDQGSAHSCSPRCVVVSPQHSGLSLVYHVRQLRWMIKMMVGLWSDVTGGRRRYTLQGNTNG